MAESKVLSFTRNLALLEAIDPDDEMHRTVAALVEKYGAGAPVAIVWGTSGAVAGKQTGLVITQYEMGQKVYRLTVEPRATSFTVRALRNAITVESDYYAL